MRGSFEDVSGCLRGVLAPSRRGETEAGAPGVWGPAPPVVRGPLGADTSYLLDAGSVTLIIGVNLEFRRLRLFCSIQLSPFWPELFLHGSPQGSGL